MSALELWLVDRTAFEVSYFRNLEPVEPWNKNTKYGQFIQAGIEGFIKTRQARGAAKFIQNEFEKQAREFHEFDDISWYAKLAQDEIKTWISLYGKDLDTYGIVKSEEKHKADLVLPSGRTITLQGNVDGEGDTIVMENKCRGDWNAEKISQEIDLNLQVNIYLTLFLAEHETLPERMWYQHIRRPGGFGYSGPRKKTKETDEQYRIRLAEAIDTDRDFHFFRYWIIPDRVRYDRFCHACLYPMLECFLDWYEWMAAKYRGEDPGPNRHHWMTPYGIYNPFTEETTERFRNWRMTGSTLGLRPKVFYR